MAVLSPSRNNRKKHSCYKRLEITYEGLIPYPKVIVLLLSLNVSLESLFDKFCVKSRNSVTNISFICITRTLQVRYSNKYDPKIVLTRTESVLFSGPVIKTGKK